MRRSSRRIVLPAVLIALAAAVSVAIAAPVSVTKPKLVGTVQWDKTVTCDPGTFDATPASIAYSWTANGGPIAKQTTDKLKVNIPYLMGGYDIACVVTATDAAGATTSVSTGAVRPVPGASTMKITSIKIKKKGAFVIKGQIGPAHLAAIAKGSDIVLNRKVPGESKAVYQLSNQSTVDSHGRFTVTGHDKAGTRSVIISFYPGHDSFGLWAPVKVTRKIKVTSGFTGSGGTSVGVGG